MPLSAPRIGLSLLKGEHWPDSVCPDLHQPDSSQTGIFGKVSEAAKIALPQST
jgi:hypothetical protein